MELYHKRSKVICDIFLKTYSDFIVVFTKFNDVYEIILQNGFKIMIYGKTKWNGIVDIMRQNFNKRKLSELL